MSVPPMKTPATQLRQTFLSMHTQGCFVIPNAWNAGSAQALAALGAQAIASSGAALAWAQGCTDGHLTLADLLTNARTLTQAVALPVHIDFESGFAEDSESLAQNIKQLLDTGIAGFSLEDALVPGELPLRDIHTSAQRIALARQVIDEYAPGTLLMARAENFFSGDTNLDDAIARLQAYAEAGADCLYAPGIRSAEQITAVVQALAPHPVNVLVGHDSALTVADLTAMGVRRISVGGALARAAWKGFLGAAREILDNGSFEGFAQTPSAADLHALLRAGAASRDKDS